MSDLAVGDVVGPLTVGRVAHGGHWVARHEGRVVFVRHALEGEVVRVRITEVAKRFARGDAVEVRVASAHRVEPPCPVAGACGGCDLQHVDLAHQRELKRQVIAEQLTRLAGVGWDGTVEDCGPGTGLGWRTRVRYVSDGTSWGLRGHRSHAVVAVPPGGCRIARPGLAEPGAEVAAGAAGEQLLGVESSDGPVWADPAGDTVVRQRFAGRDHAVHAGGFWQVHPRAVDVLTAAVTEGLEPRSGETALDLYCGVGVFAGVLAARGVEVIGVEGSRDAVALASGNVPEARFVAGSVDRVLRRLPDAVDLIVLDPPRVGAGRAVVAGILSRRPRAVAYVACDPAALARDIAFAGEQGYRAASVRAFDLFPQTHHVECVALLVPGA